MLVEDNFEMLDIFQDKQKTMEFFKEKNLAELPDYAVVTSKEEFEKEYKKLKEKNPQEKICMKYIRGEGGISFRVIEEEIGSMDSLEDEFDWGINYDLLVKMMAKSKEFTPIMLMVYLQGREISIDCLKVGEKLISIPRYKLLQRNQKIIYEFKTEVLFYNRR